MPHPAAIPAGSLQTARGDIRSPGRRVCAAAGGTRTPFQQQKCTFPKLWERLAAISPSSAFNSLFTQHRKAPGLVFPVMGYGCRGTGWALCPGTRCHSTASSATLTVTAQEAGHGLLTTPSSFWAHPSGAKSAALHELWGRRVSNPPTLDTGSASQTPHQGTVLTQASLFWWHRGRHSHQKSLPVTMEMLNGRV